MGNTTFPKPDNPRRRDFESMAPLLAEPAPRVGVLAEERARIEADMEVLRETEANLKAYEKRLRKMQEGIDATIRQRRAETAAPAPVRTKDATAVPFGGVSDPLRLEWDKLSRARELLELEQAHLRGDRIALRDETAVVRRRAQAAAEREARVAEREEAMLAGQAPVGTATAAPESAESAPMLAKIAKAPLAANGALLGRPGGGVSGLDGAGL